MSDQDIHEQIQLLQTVYPDEFKEISADPLKFNVVLESENPSLDNDTVLTISFEIPLKLSLDCTDSKVPTDELQSLLDSQLEDEPLVSIVMTAKEWLDEVEIKNEVIETEEIKFETFTPVTRERFNEWKIEFERTLFAQEAIQEIDHKLTGKQLFEKDKSLVNSDFKE